MNTFYTLNVSTTQSTLFQDNQESLIKRLDNTIALDAINCLTHQQQYWWQHQNQLWIVATKPQDLPSFYAVRISETHLRRKHNTTYTAWVLSDNANNAHILSVLFAINKANINLSTHQIKKIKSNADGFHIPLRHLSLRHIDVDILTHTPCPDPYPNPANTANLISIIDLPKPWLAQFTLASVHISALMR